MNLNLLKWRWVKFMTNSYVISNFYMKYELSMFLAKKDMDLTQILRFSY